MQNGVGWPLSIAIAVAACGQSSEPVKARVADPPPQGSTDAAASADATSSVVDRETAIQDMSRLADEMCTCRDIECSRRVADEYKQWLETRPTVAAAMDSERFVAALHRMDGCHYETSYGAAGAQALVRFVDDLCACRDARCARRITGQMKRWEREQSKVHSGPIERADQTSAAATRERFIGCLHRLMPVASE